MRNDYKSLLRNKGLLGLGEHAEYLGKEIKNNIIPAVQGDHGLAEIKRYLKSLEDLLIIIKKEFNLDETV